MGTRNMPWELNSSFSQLACGKIGFLMLHFPPSPRFQEPANDVTGGPSACGSVGCVAGRGSRVCKVSSCSVDAAQRFPERSDRRSHMSRGWRKRPALSQTLGGVALLTLFRWVLSTLLEPDKWSPRPCALGLHCHALRSPKGLEGYHLESEVLGTPRGHSLLEKQTLHVASWPRTQGTPGPQHLILRFSACRWALQEGKE